MKNLEEGELEDFREHFLSAMSKPKRVFEVRLIDDELWIADNFGNAYNSELNASQLENLRAFMDQA